MISVIIPVLNESATVGSVVRFAMDSPRVSEVIVVDDGSIDGTPELAQGAGARVITSRLLGKGVSMHEGMLAAKNDLLVYLDGDLSGLHHDLVTRLTAPLIMGKADLVKASFTREAGRVTTLTARPLLQTFFPELGDIQQPLGGIMASRRKTLERLRFEDDYGVDVGLLLDASHYQARIAQADIGHIEHDSQPLDVLGDMATQVLRVILDRAARYGRLRSEQIREVQEIERHMCAELPLLLQKVAHADRLALIDMDGVLLDGRFVVELARRTHKFSALSHYLDHATLSAESRTRFIASLFQGVPKETFIQTAQEIPLTSGAVETVVGLRKLGYRVGIVTDSYFIASEIVRRRVFADFSVAHVLKFRHEKATGEVTLARAMMAHPRGCVKHRLCKLNVLRHLTEQTRLSPAQLIAVGDGENDVCLLRSVPKSFTFQPKSGNVRAAAQFVIDGALSELLDYLPQTEEFTQDVEEELLATA